MKRGSERIDLFDLVMMGQFVLAAALVFGLAWGWWAGLGMGLGVAGLFLGVASGARAVVRRMQHKP